MRMIGAASLVALCGTLAGAPAQAQWTPPFKGNDTGGIIAYPLAAEMPVPVLAGALGRFVYVRMYPKGGPS
jgi:hypothetical protein